MPLEFPCIYPSSCFNENVVDIFVGNMTATPPREGNGLDRFLRTHGAHDDRGAHAPHVPHDEAFLLRLVHELS